METRNHGRSGGIVSCDNEYGIGQDCAVRLLNIGIGVHVWPVRLSVNVYSEIVPYAILVVFLNIVLQMDETQYGSR